MPPRSFSRFVLGALTLGLLGALAGCAPSEGDETTGDENLTATGPGVLYFHGMSGLGFAREALAGLADERPLLAPRLTDAQIQGAVSSEVSRFAAAHPPATAGGYSLGRIPLFRLMTANAPGLSRVVLIDPTFDSASGIGKEIGGGIAKAWLAGGEDRRLLFVYGDSTKELAGDKSYRRELENEPRAEICFVRGDHGRFRKADMAYALVAKDCADLEAHLGGS
jgi:hypothetical protein